MRYIIIQIIGLAHSCLLYPVVVPLERVLQLSARGDPASQRPVAQTQAEDQSVLETTVNSDH